MIRDQWFICLHLIFMSPHYWQRHTSTRLHSQHFQFQFFFIENIVILNSILFALNSHLFERLWTLGWCKRVSYLTTVLKSIGCNEIVYFNKSIWCMNLISTPNIIRKYFIYMAGWLTGCVLGSVVEHYMFPCTYISCIYTHTYAESIFLQWILMVIKWDEHDVIPMSIVCTRVLYLCKVRTKKWKSDSCTKRILKYV